MNPFKGVEKSIKKGLNKLGDEIKSGIRKVGSEVEGRVKWVGRKAEESVRKVEHEVEDKLKDTAHDLTEGLEKKGSELLDTVEDAAEEAFEAVKDEAMVAAQAALKAASSEALNKVVDAAQVLMPTEVDLSLGPFGLAIGDVSQRIDVLQKWAKNPPSSKSDIRDIILEVMPTSVSIELSFSLAFLVVQSDSLEFGVTSVYETEDFLNKMDDLLAHWGIHI